jgi:hypothetical protein
MNVLMSSPKEMTRLRSAQGGSAVPAQRAGATASHHQERAFSGSVPAASTSDPAKASA